MSYNKSNNGNDSTTDTSTESLLSETSLNLSLSPPRFPPYNSAHRSIYHGQNPANKSIALHHNEHYQHVGRGNNPHGGDNSAGDSLLLKQHPLKKREYERIHDLLVKMFQSKTKRRGRKTTCENGIKTNYYHRNKESSSSSSSSTYIPHPHISLSPETSEQITRYISSYILPLHLQNKYRDNGTFRSISDYAITCSVPTLALLNPKLALNFIHLTKNVMKRIKYGSLGYDCQTIDFFLPQGVEEDDIKGLVFFVHGGAWGSGMPWMYRLVSTPFLQSNIAVAIVGYRTYPDGNVQDQVDDLLDAAYTLKRLYPKLWCNNNKNDNNNDKDKESIGVSLMGHSSGAHIGMLLLVQLIEKEIMKYKAPTAAGGDYSKIIKDEDIKERLLFDSYVGLSGVYNIQHHFDYEAGRGVEEISPMKPACGYSREAFDYHSPALKLHKLMNMSMGMSIMNADVDAYVDTFINALIPPMLLLHGVEDDTVPFTSTSEAARIIKSCGARHCSEYYMSKTGHPDVVMHLMLGGRSRGVVMDWLKNKSHKSQVKVDELSSKL